MTPWVAMRCQTSVAKDERIDPTTMSARPTGPQNLRRRGYRVKRVKVTGAERYKMPRKTCQLTPLDVE